MAIPPEDQECTAVWALYGMYLSTRGLCGSFHVRDRLAVGVKCAAVSQERQLQLH